MLWFQEIMCREVINLMNICNALGDDQYSIVLFQRVSGLLYNGLRCRTMFFVRKVECLRSRQYLFIRISSMNDQQI